MVEMYRICLLAVLALAGCQNLVGPFAHRDPQRVDDPLLPISEQRQRGRDRLSLPEESPKVVPPAFARPGGAGFDPSQGGFR
jgi:hypothetical protein